MLCELEYNEPVYRPPSEADSLILQVTFGCSNNRCAFCDMYSSKKFRVRPVEDVKKDIHAAAKIWPDPEKIFLADGDALVLTAAKLLEICDLLHANFRGKPRLSLYATPQNLVSKSPEDLAAIRRAGISLVYVGVESGSDLILEKVRKGASSKEIETALGKAADAGFETSITWILGLGGKKYSKEHARDTAFLLSKCRSKYISALTLMLPCGDARLKENFPEWEPIDPIESLEELKIFTETYAGPRAIFRSNHASNYLPIKANLPDDKAKLISLIDEAIKHPDEYLKAEWLRGL